MRCLQEHIWKTSDINKPATRLWFWNVLSTHRRNLQNNVHVRLGLAEPAYVVLLKTAKLKVFIPRLLHALNEDDLDRRMKCCEWFRDMVQEDEAFVGKVV
ncbi:hypothetical protein ANN_17588 [Periplaneta americana]|uniref:Uncharacterized protein n=1 Tax=Periplaneta americana TaxID=6978 RepID=A0ABQ8STD7_PERAM|nr:hypothetical protein ANN_17588 [Periplaneta americana]